MGLLSQNLSDEEQRVRYMGVVNNLGIIRSQYLMHKEIVMQMSMRIGEVVTTHFTHEEFATPDFQIAFTAYKEVNRKLNECIRSHEAVILENTQQEGRLGSLVKSYTFVESEILAATEHHESELPIQRESSEVSEESFQANFENILLHSQS